VKIAGEHRSLEGKREIKGSKHASDELCCLSTFIFNSESFGFDTITLIFVNNANDIVVYSTKIGYTGSSTSGGGGASPSGGGVPPFCLSTDRRKRGSHRPGVVDGDRAMGLVVAPSLICAGIELRWQEGGGSNARPASMTSGGGSPSQTTA
jgi:hypothetical protein